MVVPRVAQVGDAIGPEQWFKSLPVITQYWFGMTLVVTLSGNLGIINPWKFLFFYREVLDKFEIWRLVTCFCYAGPFSFNTLISVFMLYQFSQQYEKGGPFNTGAGGGTADYAFALLFAMVVMLVTYPVVVMFVPLTALFTRSLVFFVLYVWSKRNPTAQSNIWGVPIPAMYLPFAYVAFTVFLGQPVVDLIHGIVIGHIYFFLVDVVPTVYGKDILNTPQFLIDHFGVGDYVPPLAGAGPPVGPGRFPPPNDAARPGAGGGGHHWGGTGQVLGRN